MPLNTVQAVQTDGLLKTSNNLSEIPDYTDQLFAVGDIKLIAGASAPNGWLACTGTSVSTTTYAALFAVIGYTFGGSGASFSLPAISTLPNLMYVIKATRYTP